MYVQNVYSLEEFFFPLAYKLVVMLLRLVKIVLHLERNHGEVQIVFSIIKRFEGFFDAFSIQN